MLPLHANASAQSVAMLRVGVFLLCAAEAVLLGQQVVTLPPDTLALFGFLSYLPSAFIGWVHTASGQYSCLTVAGVSAVAAAFGILPRVTMPVATLAFIFTQALPRALMGSSNHAQLPVMMAALLLSIGPSTDALVLWPRRTPSTHDQPTDYQSTLLFLSLILCTSYTFIAAHRLAYGGWALFSSDSMSQWMVVWNMGEPSPESTLGMQVVRQPWLARAAKLSFPLLTTVELLAPLCLISRRFRLMFVPTMLAMHTGIYLLMNVSFSQLACLYVLLIDSAYWSPRKPAVDAHGNPQPLLVLFDGVCGLCNRFVDFLVARDRTNALRFASLQGATASSIPNLPNVDSVIVADGDALRIRSDGAIAALSRLGGLWSFVAVFGLVPRPIRDAVYAFIARNRYGWFGKYDACRLPTAAEQRWFLP
jgi:predicted DCC family thiol-disulfide oxidoreductase YuxK